MNMEKEYLAKESGFEDGLDDHTVWQQELEERNPINKAIEIWNDIYHRVAYDENFEYSDIIHPLLDLQTELKQARDEIEASKADSGCKTCAYFDYKKQCWSPNYCAGFRDKNGSYKPRTLQHNIDELQAKDQEIADLKAQIEDMKCCEDCEHYGVYTQADGLPYETCEYLFKCSVVYENHYIPKTKE
jgi:hypothetical protein